MNPKNWGVGDLLAIFGCKGVNCDEMDGDRPRLPANARLMSIISDFLLCYVSLQRAISCCTMLYFCISQNSKNNLQFLDRSSTRETKLTVFCFGASIRCHLFLKINPKFPCSCNKFANSWPSLSAKKANGSWTKVLVLLASRNSFLRKSITSLNFLAYLRRQVGQATNRHVGSTGLKLLVLEAGAVLSWVVVVRCSRQRARAAVCSASELSAPSLRSMSTARRLNATAGSTSRRRSINSLNFRYDSAVSIASPSTCTVSK